MGRALDRTDKIFDRVLQDIKPSKEEAADITYKVNDLMGVLAGIVPRAVELRVAGSIARGTNLKGTADIDIFMLFDRKVSRDAIVARGIKYGKAVLEKRKGRYEIKYAEHPYIRLYLDSFGMKADIVPAFKIDNAEDMGTAVDRTPLHTEFINSHLSARQRDEVRVLKYLLKAHGIYGAEVKTEGFSGYLCELLIYHYGSLSRLLSFAAGFRLPLIISEGGTGKVDIARMLGKFNNSRFIVIDPVDPDRNVAAGVSIESLGRLVLVARRFIEKPDIKLFYGYGFSDAQARKLSQSLRNEAGLDTFLMVAGVPDKSEDVIYPQLRKMNAQIVKSLQESGFAVYMNTQLVRGRKGMLFIAAPSQRLGSRMLKGPDIFIPGASQNFIGKHKGALGFCIIGSSLYAIEKARIHSVKEALDNLPPRLLVHKDIDLRKAKLFVNKVPGSYAIPIYSELMKKLLI